MTGRQVCDPPATDDGDAADAGGVVRRLRDRIRLLEQVVAAYDDRFGELGRLYPAGRCGMCLSPYVICVWHDPGSGVLRPLTPADGDR